VFSADRHHRYYGYGRQALDDALQVCGCTQGDTILYPDFTCDVTLEPAHRQRLKVVYYPLKDDMTPDWTALTAITRLSRAKVVMSVNFFGTPQPMAQWHQFARDRSLLWINDNAHGYGGMVEGKPLERHGDVSFTSMRKVLPLLNGSMLRVNRADLVKNLPESSSMPIAAHLPIEEERRRVLRSIARAVGISQRRPRETPYRCMPASGEMDTRRQIMDPVSKRLLGRYHPRRDAFAQIRRCLYAAWEQCCGDRGLQPVFPNLSPEASPMVFPCYAADFAHRQKWMDWSVAKNVDIYPWPSLPKALRYNVSPAVHRWRRLLCFPIHPFMTPEEIHARF